MKKLLAVLLSALMLASLAGIAAMAAPPDCECSCKCRDCVGCDERCICDCVPPFGACHKNIDADGDGYCDFCGHIIICGCCNEHRHSNSFIDLIACFFCRIWQFFSSLF
ncbi:MAG: hypothetical protein FWF08_00465 [Oscillospiraceae bacterium]|nr:hypothetical protein [Oscillospiraceae bacterium]